MESFLIRKIPLFFRHKMTDTSAMEAFQSVLQNQLSLKLTRISVRELSFMEKAPCDVYSFQNGQFVLILSEQDSLEKAVLKNLVIRGHWYFFVTYDDHDAIRDHAQSELRHVTRSFSMGDPLKNAIRQMTLLSLNLSYLYRNPSDNQALELQFQCVNALASFLLNQNKGHGQLYAKFSQKDFHYTITQPLLSSLLLISFLKQTFHFNRKEMENLFAVSYFKDIGMALIPEETYDKKELGRDERLLLHNHPQNSVKILDGRIPLAKNHLRIIENHHSHSLVALDSSERYSQETISGLETMLVAAMDTVTAVTSPRPYRTEGSWYQALEVIKSIMAKKYPEEFKLLIQFFQNFFGRVP